MARLAGLAAGVAAACLLSGCGTVASGATVCNATAMRSQGPSGTLNFTLSGGRRVQYRASQIQSLHLVLTNQANGQNYASDYPGTGSSFAWEVLNLPVGTYGATLTAYTDTAETNLIGSSTATFSVQNQSTTNVVFPAMNLVATPTGTWTVNTAVTGLPSGFTVNTYSFTLQESDGTVVTQAVATSSPTISNQWGNVVAFPTLPSTISVVVTATKKNGTKTAGGFVATTIVSGGTATSNLAVAFNTGG